MLEKLSPGLALGQLVLWALIGPEYLATITTRPISPGMEAFAGYTTFYAVGFAILTVPGVAALYFNLRSERRPAASAY